MVEAMGGQGSDYYVQFRMYACEAYNILRKSADLICYRFNDHHAQQRGRFDGWHAGNRVSGRYDSQ